MRKCEFCGNEIGEDDTVNERICRVCVETLYFAFNNPNFDKKKMKLRNGVDEIELDSPV